MTTMTRRSLLKLSAATGAAAGLALPGTVRAARAARTKNLVVVGQNGNLNIVTPGGAMLMYYQYNWQTGLGSFIGPSSNGSGFESFSSIASCGVAYTYDNIYVCVNSSGVYGYYWKAGPRSWANSGAAVRIATTSAAGWANLSKVFSGGCNLSTPDRHGNVFYTIDSSGQLFWHKYLGVPGEGGYWAANSGRRIGVGWGGFQYVTAAATGTFYAVDNTGTMRWYRYTDPDGGASNNWAANPGRVIGAGWYGGPYGYQTVQSAGVDWNDGNAYDGGLYMVDKNGDLRWNRHQDWYSGKPDWDYPTGGGPIIGRGWM
ncbi:hypothetical protein GCM10010168_20540 [Actinoplanes ianthinogenes]|uniref:Tachylectin 2 domain-containing protein n=1 Tax=Actinoplanes ianthinogenes TaxID=122358 RepID=A0ABM7M7V3_9ACTN|nr:tachylectin-related carbohydrate-binding protein [Actinoplanes ianthinogenes]BCJ47695.1 hypothetical protein Aiant_83520 [Actinoplanes ianthinogenes]GGR03531.1 hypothetical protein GCM10010168_20540 [Actinoplanes ianthinogenes]